MEAIQYPDWLRVASAIVNQFNYGDTIEHEWLYGMLRLHPPKTGGFYEVQKFQFKYMRQIDFIKTELLENNQMYLESVKGVGYTIVDPTEQSGLVWSKMVSLTQKCFRRTAKGLININHDKLTGRQIMDANNKLVHLAQLTDATRRITRNERTTVVQVTPKADLSEQRIGRNGTNNAEEEKEQARASSI